METENKALAPNTKTSELKLRDDYIIDPLIPRYDY